MSTTESTQGSSSRRGQQHKRSAPTGTARRHHNWFDTFFDDPFISRFFPTRFSRGSTGKEITGTDTTALTTPDFIPLTDVSETDALIRIVCDLPGLSKQDVNIDLDEENRILTLSGEITRDKQEENETFHSLERVYGNFRRSVYLPQEADLSGIKARVENGVLRVTVPKIEQTSKKVKTIAIE